MRHLFLLFVLITISAWGQKSFSHADSLRGGYGKGRNWWDLTHYDLSVTFHPEAKTIQGKNVITYNVLQLSETGMREMQIDLQEPMILDSVVCFNKILPFRKDGNAYFFEPTFENSENQTITVYFHGSPREAKLPPWDGGIIWKKDKNGLPWITIACQGLGASVWFPCKDSQVDEPQSVSMHYTVPNPLFCVSNGTFDGKKTAKNGYSTYSWSVKNPINNYCMIPYIGDYVNLHDHYTGEKGSLEMDFWTLSYHVDEAKKQFPDAIRTLQALEFWFGPYPFYEDGYKLVEAPHLGMEHQSAIAYGNGFQNGYKGTDLSGTGVGLKWDFIIVHESGHEWFGNNITSKDVADMWIHESFTNYSEVLFSDYFYGKAEGNRYCIGLRKNILNDKPIIGPYGVQEEGSGDMYYKGANMLHTIRTIVNNDSLFRATLRGLNHHFYHQTVTTQEIEDYMSEQLHIDLAPIFDQYLRATNIPVVVMKQKGNKVKYKWTNCVNDFDMPLVTNLGKVNCSTRWSKIIVENETKLLVDPNLYIKVKQ